MVSRIAPKAAAEAASKKSFALISDATLKKLYVTMLECRLLEDQLRVTRRGRNANNPSRNLREATAVGLCMHLRKEDVATSQVQSAMLAYGRTARLGAILSRPTAVGKGKSDENTRIEELSLSNPLMVLNTSTAAQFNFANGLSVATAAQSRETVVVSFAAYDGAINHDTIEAFRFAAKHRLPALFIIHREATGDDTDTLTRQLEDSGVPCIPVDGQDVVAVYRVAQESITRARQQGGPTVIDAISFSAASHETLDTAADSLAHMERYLTGKGLFSGKLKQQRTEAFRKKLSAVTRNSKPSSAVKGMRA